MGLSGSPLLANPSNIIFSPKRPCFRRYASGEKSLTEESRQIF